jgi:hypothetical protein
MVNASKQNIWPILAGKYAKLTKRCTQRHHQPSEGKSGLEADRFLAFGAFCSMQTKKKLVAKKQ